MGAVKNTSAKKRTERNYHSYLKIYYGLFILSSKSGLSCSLSWVFFLRIVTYHFTAKSNNKIEPIKACVRKHAAKPNHTLPANLSR